MDCQTKYETLEKILILSQLESKFNSNYEISKWMDEYELKLIFSKKTN